MGTKEGRKDKNENEIDAFPCLINLLYRLIYALKKMVRIYFELYFVISFCLNSCDVIRKVKKIVYQEICQNYLDD